MIKEAKTDRVKLNKLKKYIEEKGKEAVSFSLSLHKEIESSIRKLITMV